MGPRLFLSVLQMKKGMPDQAQQGGKNRQPERPEGCVPLFVYCCVCMTMCVHRGTAVVRFFSSFFPDIKKALQEMHTAFRPNVQGPGKVSFRTPK